MSSVGQAVGGVVGAVVGFFTPLGPLYGAQIGMMIGGVLDPPKTKGPRLEDLTAQTSVYGAFIPRLYGVTAVAGNVIWIQGDKLIERSSTSGGKGGPEVTTYNYFATFAVALCEGPIAGVRRIWIGGRLWYDAGSDDISTIIASNESASLFTLYTGTDTQQADPLIQADRGVANVSAYRGLAYIVFDELPLKDYSNSLVGAQVKVEVIATASATTTPEVVYLAYLPGGPTPLHSPVFDHPFTKDPGNRVAFTAHARTSGSSTADTSFQPIAIYTENLPPRIYDYDAAWADMPYPYYCETDATYYRFKSSGGITHIEIDGVEYETGLTGLSTTDYQLRFLDTGKFVFLFVRKPGGGTLTHYLVVINRAADLPVVTSYTLTLSTNPAFAYDRTSDQVVMLWPDRMDFYSNANGNFLNTVAYTADGRTIGGVSIDGGVLWNLTSTAGGTDLLRGRSLVDGSVVYDYSWASPGAGSFSGYVINDLLYYTKNTGTSETSRFFYVMRLPGHLTPSTVALSDIVEAECLQSDLLTAGDLDVTELTEQVRGYRVSSLSPLRGGIDQLRKAWPFDAIQHGYKIKFKARGGASVATITEGELDAREAGAASGVRLSNTREMDLILPQQLMIQYLDAAREYDVNVAEEERV